MPTKPALSTPKPVAKPATPAAVVKKPSPPKPLPSKPTVRRAKMPRWPFLLLGAGVVGVAIWRRKDVATGAGIIFDAAKRAAFKAIIPWQAQPYADDILDVSQAEGVSPFITVALGMRESQWGNTLTPKGPGGYGDYTPRSWTKTPLPPTPAPLAVQRGWGFGLMQLDYAYFSDWLEKNKWWVPKVIIAKALDELKKHIAFFAGNSALRTDPSYLLTDGSTVTITSTFAKKLGVSAGQYPDPRPLSGDALMRAALAAYNAGDASVLRALAVGKSPDTLTTGADYGSAVFAAAMQLQGMLGS